MSNDKSQLIQLQLDRMYLNWVKIGEGPYPRFSTLLPRFVDYLGMLGQFIDSFRLGTLRALQYELSYTNQIHHNKLWNDLSQAHRVLPFLSIDESANFPAPVVSFSQNHYAFDTLTVTADAKTGKRVDNQEDIIYFELKASSGSKGVAPQDIQTWFGEANQELRRAFKALTSPEVRKEVWGEIDE